MNDNKIKTENLLIPIALGIGVVALITKLFSKSESNDCSESQIASLRDKKIFISFAKEDERYRDYLVKQAKESNSPFDFIDMSVKRPWKEFEWKEKCRQKIKKCDGMIVLLSKKTWHSSGARWEIKCAKEENIDVVGMHIQKHNKGSIPPELKGKRIIEWSWKNLEKTIKSIKG
ncbi:TIR domain-containing protein [Tenacibaculum maritimum]|uniref:TIR domain-containing protein n=1 Tax=Tenacibaculum maritimum TaxID=107401 RepID=UPI0012E4D3E8|nr:TIR domain-containing protein [Tenacibaculum maritimum]CAA0162409.1 conserved hypothetical protein [Tenacibaculum maritimum]CAA0258413.1 conserved hypothetical protein [Tenacibaculum maritimum]